MIVNLVARANDATPNLVMYGQSLPLDNIKPVQYDLVLFVPGLTVELPTPDQIAAAVWGRAGRTLT